MPHSYNLYSLILGCLGNRNPIPLVPDMVHLSKAQTGISEQSSSRPHKLQHQASGQSFLHQWMGNVTGHAPVNESQCHPSVSNNSHRLWHQLEDLEKTKAICM